MIKKCYANFDSEEVGFELAKIIANQLNKVYANDPGSSGVYLLDLTYLRDSIRNAAYKPGLDSPVATTNEHLLN